MEQNKKKLFVLDMDKNFDNLPKKFPPKMKKKIISNMEEGNIVALISSRPISSMYWALDQLQLEKYGGYIISFDGGKIFNYKTGEIIYQKILPNYIVSELYSYVNKKDMGIFTYLGNNIISGKKIDKYTEIESKMNGMKIREVVNFPEYVDYDINKCKITISPDKAEEHVQILKEKYGDILDIYISEPFFIDFMPKNINRENSINRLLNYIGLLKDDIIWY